MILSTHDLSSHCIPACTAISFLFRSSPSPNESQLAARRPDSGVARRRHHRLFHRRPHSRLLPRAPFLSTLARISRSPLGRHPARRWRHSLRCRSLGQPLTHVPLHPRPLHGYDLPRRRRLPRHGFPALSITLHAIGTTVLAPPFSSPAKSSIFTRTGPQEFSSGPLAPLPVIFSFDNGRKLPLRLCRTDLSLEA